MVPIDLEEHYQSRRINFSLRTKSGRDARQLASAVSVKLEGYWQHLRLQGIAIPGSRFLKVSEQDESTDDVVLFSEAVELYLRLKGHGKPKTSIPRQDELVGI